jgi:hypothetical protein
MIVRESLDFERGQEPKKSMDIGLRTWDNIKPGDILIPKKEVQIDGKGKFVSDGRGDTIWADGMVALVLKVQKFYDPQEAKHIINLGYFKCWDKEEGLKRRNHLHDMIPTRRMYGTRIQYENRFKILQKKDES